MNLEFPENFLWGAATSDHQVEGGSIDDWAAWERKNAEHLANTAEERLINQARILGTLPPNWGEVKVEAADPNNYISGSAVEHYQKYPTDLEMLKDLNLNSYRFSISWGRVMPEPGVIDTKALEHYRQMLLEMQRLNITPMVTLNHYNLPIWLGEQGGWLAQDSSKFFQQYCEAVVRVLKPYVNLWITLNEPVPYAFASYVDGDWPPAHKGHYFKAIRVIYKLIRAHHRAYDAIKKIDPDAQVSIVNNFAWVEKKSGIGLKGYWKAALYELLLNRLLFWLIGDSFDFLAINHYFRFKFKRGLDHNFKQMSDMGWELYPPGLGLVAEKLYDRYQKPVYITEHGLADAEDKHREWFIKESLVGLHQAIQNGVDVRGYFHWSLLDNFEWDKGWWPKFGLIEIDRRTQQRKIRPSAKAYGKIAAKNAITI